MLEQWEPRASVRFVIFGLVAALTTGSCSGDAKKTGGESPAASDDDADEGDEDADEGDEAADDALDDDNAEAPKKDASASGKKSDASSGSSSSMKDAGTAPPTKDDGAKDPVAPPDAGNMTSVPLTPKGKNCLEPGNGNYNAPGPYKVAKKEIDLGMVFATQHTGKYTVYYPMPFDPDCLHPIVAWGNGTGVTDSSGTYDFLNSNAASWGMVVTSPAEDNTGSGAFHKAGIDYLLKENADPNSIFFGKLSTRAGVSGHSQGGFGATAASNHPNVVAAVVEGASFTATMKVPALTLTGTMDLGIKAADAVARAGGPMFVAVWEGGNHIGTETVLGFLGLDSTSGDAAQSQKGSKQFQRLYAAWFRCFLADDEVACKLFSGGTPDNCGICKDPGWAKLASAKM